MIKSAFATLLFSFFITVVFAQPQTSEPLEKQRPQLKKEIEQTESQLRNNRAQTKTNLLEYNLISKKVALQDRVIEHISRDLSMLNNNINVIQRDIHKYDRILDT